MSKDVSSLILLPDCLEGVLTSSQFYGIKWNPCPGESIAFQLEPALTMGACQQGVVSPPSVITTLSGIASSWPGRDLFIYVSLITVCSLDVASLATWELWALSRPFAGLSVISSLHSMGFLFCSPGLIFGGCPSISQESRYE